MTIFQESGSDSSRAGDDVGFPEDLFMYITEALPILRQGMYSDTDRRIGAVSAT